MRHHNPTPSTPQAQNQQSNNIGYRYSVIPTKTYKSKPIKAGAKVPLQRKMPPAVSNISNSVAFSGAGFVPDLMSDGARMVTFPAAVATKIEGGLVVGREAMLPPYGNLPRLQKGQKMDAGAGGSGAFCTGFSVGAKG